MRVRIFSSPTKYEKVKFHPFKVGWLINRTSVDRPLRNRKRVTLCGGYLDRDGRFVEGVFIYKKVAYKMNKYGEVFVLGSGVLKMECMELWLTDSEVKRRRMDALCKLACDPNSETYWSM